MEYIDKAKPMAKIENEYREWGEDYDAYQILGDIEDFPVVEDVVPVGEWIAPNEFFDQKAYRKCSLCGMHFDIYPPYKAFDGRVYYTSVRVCNYCPNCGAKMEKPKFVAKMQTLK